MTKEQQEFEATMLRHASYKKYENYVLSGIYWGLHFRGIELEFVTQQTVFRKSEKNHVAYLDGYFPALNLQIEVDEAQHQSKYHRESDKRREVDVMKVLGSLNIEPDVIRIDATKDLDSQILNAIADIIYRYEKLKFPKWRIENPCDKIKKNHCIKFEDNDVFKFKNELVNAIGFRTRVGKEYPKTGTQSISLLKFKSGDELWFPTMTDNDITGWLNSYDFNTNEFRTQLVKNFIHNDNWKKNEEKFKAGTIPERYIIFKAVDSMNRRGFKYYGKYKCIFADAKTQTEVWKRVSTEDLKFD